MKHSHAVLAALAAVCCLAGAPALAQQASAPDTIATARQDAAPAAAPAATAPAPAPVATPEQQAALAGARAANTPAPPNVLAGQPPSAAGSLLQTVLSLAFVIALLVGLAWLLKRFGPKSVTGGTTVKLVGALSVGARERILVVEVGEQWIVVGASPGRMNALATMPRQEIDAAALAGQPLPGANFAEWFKQTIDKRNGN